MGISLIVIHLDSELRWWVLIRLVIVDISVVLVALVSVVGATTRAAEDESSDHQSDYEGRADWAVSDIGIFYWDGWSSSYYCPISWLVILRTVLTIKQLFHTLVFPQRKYVIATLTLCLLSSRCKNRVSKVRVTIVRSTRRAVLSSRRDHLVILLAQATLSSHFHRGVDLLLHEDMIVSLLIMVVVKATP